MRASSPHITLNLNTLTDAERSQLVALLFPVHQRIFDGSTSQSFKQQVLQCNADYSYLRVRLNRLGEAIGYCTVHFFHIDQGERPASIMRSQAGLLPEYRRGNSVTPFILRTILGYRLRHPRRRLSFFATLIHPSSYLLCDKYARQFWPRPSSTLPAESWRLLRHCLLRFGYQASHEATPQVVSVGLRTLDRDSDRAFWQRSDKPAVRFFLRNNPGYADGHGLVTLMPLTLSNLFTVATRLLHDRIQRRLRGKQRS
jgi:hypothetical protein